MASEVAGEGRVGGAFWPSPWCLGGWDCGSRKTPGWSFIVQSLFSPSQGKKPSPPVGSPFLLLLMPSPTLKHGLLFCPPLHPLVAPVIKLISDTTFLFPPLSILSTFLLGSLHSVYPCLILSRISSLISFMRELYCLWNKTSLDQH